MSGYNNVVQLIIPQQGAGVPELKPNKGGQSCAQECGSNPQDEVQRTNIFVVSREKPA